MTSHSAPDNLPRAMMSNGVSSPPPSVGEEFTLYGRSSQNMNGNGASTEGPIIRSTIQMKYEPPSASARLGAFMWKTVSDPNELVNGRKRTAEPVNILPVHLISDVFLGMQTDTFRGCGDLQPAPVEDHCFSLVSKNASLDLEGRSIEATKAWLKQLSAIINSSGKDIVLAADGGVAAGVGQVSTPASGRPSISAASVNGEVEAIASTGSTTASTPTAASGAAAANGSEAKVETVPTAVPVEPTKDDVKPAPKLKAAGSSFSSKMNAHDLMTIGGGFPFTFHYLALEGARLTRTNITVNFKKDPSGGYFVLKTVEPALRPKNVHTCLTEPHTSTSSDNLQTGDLCIWDAKIFLTGLTDVYLGVTQGLFRSQPSLSKVDVARCVTLCTDDPPPAQSWDLEAPSSAEFVEWLSAFNKILAGSEQEVALETTQTPPPVTSPAAIVAPKSIPASVTNSKPVTASATPAKVPTPVPNKTVDPLRKGGYFYLYSVGTPMKKLIFLFYNDDASRPLHFTENQVQIESIASGDIANVNPRSSLFYRYVPEVNLKQLPTTQPLETDECVSIYQVTDFLLGKQTELMCQHPLTTFVNNNSCFSLIINRVNYSTQRTEQIEIGLECVEPSQMSIWLEGIMEISNSKGAGGAENEISPVTEEEPSISRPYAAVDGPKPPPLYVASNSQSTIVPIPSSPSHSLYQGPGSVASAAPVTNESKLSTIEHVVSSPRTSSLNLQEPSLKYLQAGVVFVSWENYEQPEQRKLVLWYDLVGPTPTTGSSKTPSMDFGNVATTVPNGGYFYWNYLPADYPDFTQPPAEKASEWKIKNKHSSFSLEALQSVYHGRVASIFSAPNAGVSLPKADTIISLLTTDDLLNLQAESADALTRWLDGLKYLLTTLCAKNLIKVESSDKSSVVSHVGEAEQDHSFEVNEWFNIQEAVFPVNLSKPPVTAVVVASAVPQTPSQALSPGRSSVAALLTSPTGGAGGTTNEFPPLSPKSEDDALVRFAVGQQFTSWSLDDQGKVLQNRITLFFQQTPDDLALFFVWVNTGDEAELQQAKLWSRSIKHSSELRNLPATHKSGLGKPYYPHLLISNVSDLHIGKNLPIFNSAGPSLIADECVSIVAADCLPGPQELHLVATEGIKQIASAISAVTNLLERDGTRLSPNLWTILRGGNTATAGVNSGVDVAAKKLDFNESSAASSISSSAGVAAAPAVSVPSTATPADAFNHPLLVPLRNGASFWLWSFVNSSDQGLTVRKVQRREITLKWQPTSELGTLSWSNIGSSTVSGTVQASHVSDIYVGAEAEPFNPQHLVATIGRNDVSGTPTKYAVSDDRCFSIISQGGDVNEVHLECMDPSVVDAWVEGLSCLLQSGGRSLTEETVASTSNTPGPASNGQQNESANGSAVATGTATPVTANGTATSSTSQPATVAVANPPAAVVVTPPTVPAPVKVPSQPFPTFPDQPSLVDILRIVQVLSQAADEQSLGGYKEADIERALAAIRDAAATQPPELMEDVMSAGAARVVVDSMRAFPDSEAVQLTGAGACWCLATTGENEATVVQAGGLDINRSNLAKYPNNPMLLQQICGAIRNLTVADAHKELFCRGGPNNELGIAACKNLVTALLTHAPATALAQQASGSIAALAMYGPNKQLLGEVGAIPAIVYAMNFHTGSDDTVAQVHEECCAALRNLAANHAANKETIAACGGIEAIVKSMRVHESSALNQLHGAGALWNVPANNAANKALVAKSGGIQILLNAIRLHSNDAEVQLECIGSLRNLSTLVENKPLILSAGTVPVVLETMRRLVDVSLLQEQACALIFNLANYASDAQASVLSLIDQKAPEIVLKILATHIHSPNVVEEACASLWIMHRAAPEVDWPQAFRDEVLRLADSALAIHPTIPGVVNFAAGMRGAWSTKAKSASSTNSTTGPTIDPSAGLLNEHAQAINISSPTRAHELQHTRG